MKKISDIVEVKFCKDNLDYINEFIRKGYEVFGKGYGYFKKGSEAQYHGGGEWLSGRFKVTFVLYEEEEERGPHVSR